MSDPYLSAVLAHHRHAEEMVRLTSGGESRVYYDLREAMLCSCRATLVVWYVRQVAEMERQLGIKVAAVVGTGIFGGQMTVELHRHGWQCALWKDAEHGRAFSGAKLEPGDFVIVFDDVVSTGRTMQRMKQALVSRGLNVVGEVAAVRRAEVEAVG